MPESVALSLIESLVSFRALFKLRFWVVSTDTGIDVASWSIEDVADETVTSALDASIITALAGTPAPDDPPSPLLQLVISKSPETRAVEVVSILGVYF